MRRADPDLVRALVREELARRLSSPPSPLLEVELSVGEPHPSFLDVMAESECQEGEGAPSRRACLIEPHRLCSNSGYCRKLGY